MHVSCWSSGLHIQISARALEAYGSKFSEKQCIFKSRLFTSIQSHA